MTKINYQEFNFWLQRWIGNHKVGARLGQDFCNHFYQKIGRGDHTLKLFYSTDDDFSQKFIYENFISH